MEALRNRMKEIEEEAQMIRKMQNDVEKQMNMSTTSSGNAPPQLSMEEKMEADSRSVYVGNVGFPFIVLSRGRRMSSQ